MKPSQVISGYFRFQSKSKQKSVLVWSNCNRCSLLGHSFVPLLPSVLTDLIRSQTRQTPEAPHNHHLHPEQSQQPTHIEETRASNQTATYTHTTPYLSFNDYLWLSKNHLYNHQCIFSNVRLTQLQFRAAPWVSSWTKSHGASIDSGSFQLLQVPMIKNPLTSHWIPVGIQFWYTVINIIAQGGIVNEGANK